MSGKVTLLLLLSCCKVYAQDDIEPPQELNVVVSLPGEVSISWKNIVPPQNITVKYHVKIITPEGKKEDFKTDTNNISKMVLLHEGITVQVAAIYIPIYNSSSKNSEVSNWIEKKVPPYPGVEGTSITNLSCQIDIDVSEQCYLSCKWVPGEKAPTDTEYNLYYRYGMSKNDAERCQDYITEPRGHRRTGCRIPSRFLSLWTNKYLLVHINGTSKSLQIKAIEEIYLKSDIEVIPPVRNLTIDMNGLHWIKPINSLPESCFRYDVNTWSRDSNETIQIRHTKHDFRKPFRKQFFRVRAVGEICWPNVKYGVWSDTIHIGEDDRSATLEIIVSVCLVAACIVIFLVCIRFWGQIFPHIPKPKNDLKEAFQNVQSQALMRCNSLDNEEVISYIEEIIETDKSKMSSDYGHIGNYSSTGSYKTL